MTYTEVRALRDAQRDGVCFRRTVTLGRQWLLAGPRDLARALAGCRVDAAAKAKLLADPPKWADELFRLFGAAEVSALDASPYEGADILHNLNDPPPPGLAGRFDLVFDGGTTEHVFDVPRALRTAMELASVGGHVLVSVPANNALGHGLYQFSPELYYRVFAPENGFEVRWVTLTEAWSGKRYAAADPAKLRRRVELYATAPTLMLTALARRVADVPIFANPPAQSDYAAAWDGEARPHAPAARPWHRRLLSRFGERFAPGLIGYVRYRRSLDLKWHPDLFRPLAD
ncbi:MAG: hypothetical protein U0746_18145 [Gemmataceae bacterium]